MTRQLLPEQTFLTSLQVDGYLVIRDMDSMFLLKIFMMHLMSMIHVLLTYSLKRATDTKGTQKNKIIQSLQADIKIIR